MNDQTVRAFIDRYPDAAMTTLREDGTPCAARVEVAVVDGRIWSTGSPKLVRTRNLLRDPRCSLFVFGPHPSWVGLETTVTMLNGPDAPDHLVRMLRERHKDDAPAATVLAHDDKVGHDRPYTIEEYSAHARAEGLFVFQFEVLRAYGNA